MNSFYLLFLKRPFFPFFEGASLSQFLKTPSFWQKKHETKSLPYYKQRKNKEKNVKLSKI